MSLANRSKKEREALANDLLAKWTLVGLSTEPANRSLALEGVEEMYSGFGAKSPRIHWCASPREAARQRRKQLTQREMIPPNALRELNFQIGLGLRVRLSVIVEKIAPKRFAAAAKKKFIDTSFAGYGSCLTAAAFPRRIYTHLNPQFYGQHDALWLAYYDFFAQVYSRPDLWKPLRGLARVVSNAGLIIPHQNDCWIVDRPCENQIQEQSSAKQKFLVRYRDGFKVRFASYYSRSGASRLNSKSSKNIPF
jgi:hypothetical protein